ncbi:MAG: S1 RNA-binding domain-containing protein, partial [Ilumatobacteraceae bacterium]
PGHPAKQTDSGKGALPTPEPTLKSTGTNDLLAFLNFVEHHQPGSSVNAIVESYSSHGAYVRIGDVKGYVPLSLMADPAPRSAREFMKVGESVTLVVESFAPTRRSIDLAIPTMAAIKSPPPEPIAEAKPKRAPRKAASKAPSTPEAAVTSEAAPAPKKRATKKLAEPGVAPVVAKKASRQKAPAEKPPAERSHVAKAQPEPSIPAAAPAQPPRKRASKKAAAAPAPTVESTEPPKPSRRRSKST